MKQFIAFVIKETRHILRDKRTMLVLFGMPVVMMLLFGFAISTDVKNVRTIIVTSAVDHQTQQCVEALGANEYFDILYKVNTPAEAERLIRDQKADMAVVFLSGERRVKNEGSNSIIQVIVDGADPNMAQMYANYASQILGVKGEEGRVKSEEGRVKSEERRVKNHNALLPVSSSETQAAEQENSSLFTLRSSLKSSLKTSLLFNPQMRSCYNFVPGIMGMLLMLICAMMTSISIVREKERGTMEVLLVSPVSPLMTIVAKVVPYLALAFAILTSILLISRYVLDVPVAGSLFWIFVVSGIYILVALSLGLLISTVAKTQLVALLASAMMLMLPSILLSGMMFPVESMPTVLQYISAVIPPRYYISAMRKLLIMGVDIDKVAQEVAVLLIMLVVLLTAALLNFKKRLE